MDHKVGDLWVQMSGILGAIIENTCTLKLERPG